MRPDARPPGTVPDLHPPVLRVRYGTAQVTAAKQSVGDIQGGAQPLARAEKEGAGDGREIVMPRAGWQHRAVSVLCARFSAFRTVIMTTKVTVEVLWAPAAVGEATKAVLPIPGEVVGKAATLCSFHPLFPNGSFCSTGEGPASGSKAREAKPVNDCSRQVRDARSSKPVPDR
ncbi:hypothetical protein EJ06DRAFT_142472 [Trichodelitschia bisporula]|uniref:Uncharacterized protein n=1 Tax=Trichodelitschia bisporula TaxID=703511 RepID=A0A6G1HPB3_9PEZI|nr:hypothetical protein EJ06DRAFT_142472 [Trichodelitschia bisporula]